MRLRGLIAALLVAVGVSAAAASIAAAQVSFAVPLSSGTVTSLTDVPFRTSGALTVSFAGSAGAGCARLGVCGYRGTVSTLIPGGELTILKLRRKGRTSYLADVVVYSSTGNGPETSARVQRIPAAGASSTCIDGVTSGLGTLSAGVAHGVFALQLLDRQGGLLSTRCAGPTDADLATVSPRVRIAVATVRRGGRAVDLSGTTPFSAGGFAGTLTSTVVLHLGNARTRPGGGGTQAPPGFKLVRTRTVSVSIQLAGISGRLRAAVMGDPDPNVCSLLDACGAQGTISLAPEGGPGSGELFVQGPARAPVGRLLASLGLGPGRPGPAAIGGLTWSDPSSATAELDQNGDRCLGAAPLGVDVLSLRTTRTRLQVSFNPEGTLRSECPGPFVEQPERSVDLAAGNVPLSRLGHRTLTVVLRAIPSFADDGYAIRLSGALAVRLRRGPVVQHVNLQLAFSRSP